MRRDKSVLKDGDKNGHHRRNLTYLEHIANQTFLLTLCVRMKSSITKVEGETICLVVQILGFSKDK